jgi:hypothetical protein
MIRCDQGARSMCSRWRTEHSEGLIGGRTKSEGKDFVLDSYIKMELISQFRKL